MGIPYGPGYSANNPWNVFLWEVGSADVPINLSDGKGTRDEDPKFSPDDNSIVFKSGPAGQGQLYLMNTDGSSVRPVLAAVDGIECSMPFFTPDGRGIVFSQGQGATAGLYGTSLQRRAATKLTEQVDLQEYYPVAWKNNSFLYTRWLDKDRRRDQIYALDLSNKVATALPFNAVEANNSDPYPATENWIFFSSNRAGGKGGYDLYLGDAVTGTVWIVSDLGASALNSASGELGAAYSD